MVSPGSLIRRPPPAREATTYAIVRANQRTRESYWLLLRIETGLVPILKHLPGFCGYYAIPVSRRRFFSVTLFRHRWQAEAALPVINEWFAGHVLDLIGRVPPAEVLEIAVAEPGC